MRNTNKCFFEKCNFWLGSEILEFIIRKEKLN